MSYKLWIACEVYDDDADRPAGEIDLPLGSFATFTEASDARAAAEVLSALGVDATLRDHVATACRQAAARLTAQDRPGARALGAQLDRWALALGALTES